MKMKHRSLVIFVIIMMALTVAPQVTQQLGELKNAAAEELKAGIWNIFLSLHAKRLEAAGKSPAASQLTPRAGVEVARRSSSSVRAKVAHNGAAGAGRPSPSDGRGGQLRHQAPAEPFLKIITAVDDLGVLNPERDVEVGKQVSWSIPKGFKFATAVTGDPVVFRKKVSRISLERMVERMHRKGVDGGPRRLGADLEKALERLYVGDNLQDQTQSKLSCAMPTPASTPAEITSRSQTVPAPFGL